jgi:hypothetical protein
MEDNVSEHIETTTTCTTCGLSEIEGRQEHGISSEDNRLAGLEVMLANAK